MPPSLSTATTLKRIHREIADLKKEDLGAIALAPSDDNLFAWSATIPGPEGSCYENGLFHVSIELAHDYPFSAPKVTFRTRIYHMNINDHGNICIDILKHNWSPALSLFKVILSLSSLLTDPNPKDPLVPSIATEYVRNRAQHDRTARNWTEIYALPRAPAAPAKAKGKSRAADISVPPAAGSSTGAHPRRGSAGGDVITIDDSDGEGSPRVRRTPRTRAATKRKRGAEDEVVIEDASPVRPARRRRGAPRAGGSRATGGDVIVIED
ncbi:ubiquitin-conjugating enzyme/RWD-like protein [Amylocystis lapponica]|nr:ubiquitin-conjugating enzyme/RWD-like protein [Amylocystis lapponica]